MFLKKRKASTDPRLRSLLQKAARRGYPDVVELVARRLYDNGDRTWMRSRAVVITFEECWPLAQRLALSKEPESKFAALREVTSVVKQKDAAGLGALGFAYHEGDHSMVHIVPDPWALRMVSEAIDRPQAFFEWAASHSRSEASAKIVDSAKRYLAAATWGWDKACIIAGAFLAVTKSIPDLEMAPIHDTAFPFWVALDKHTPQGKVELRRLSAEFNLPYRHLIWSNFYFESAVVNSITESPWWNVEMKWRLHRAGLTLETGAALWKKVRIILRDRLAVEADNLRAIVESPTNIRNGVKSMFDP